jgi:HlyD family secretion protein
VIEVANPDGVLLPGMTATAKFAVADNRNVLLVPNAALAFRPEGFDPRQLREAARGKRAAGASGETAGFPATVFVAGPRGEPEPRLIRIGASDDDNSVVLSGPLAAGDRIIVADREAKRDTPGGGPPGGG